MGLLTKFLQYCRFHFHNKLQCIFWDYSGGQMVFSSEPGFRRLDVSQCRLKITFWLYEKFNSSRFH